LVRREEVVTDLDAAIRAKMAVDQDSYYFEYDCAMIRDAVFAGLELHAAGYPSGEVEYEDRDEPAYNSNGVVIGSIRVKGDPVPPYWCNTCQEMAPCPTVKAIATGLGIEVET
jgi:hypothetical protein